MNSKILLASYGGGHVNVIIPLYKELTSRGFKPVVLAFTTAAEVLQREGIEFYRYIDFLNSGDASALDLGSHIVRNMQLDSSVSKRESIAYMGIGFQELIDTEGEERAEKMYQQYGRYCFLPLKFMHRILSILEPDMVITTNSPRSEKALIMQAREIGQLHII